MNIPKFTNDGSNNTNGLCHTLLFVAELVSLNLWLFEELNRHRKERQINTGHRINTLNPDTNPTHLFAASVLKTDANAHLNLPRDRTSTDNEVLLAFK